MSLIERIILFICIGFVMSQVYNLTEKPTYAQELGSCVYSLQQADREIDYLMQFRPGDRFEELGGRR